MKDVGVVTGTTFCGEEVVLVILVMYCMVSVVEAIYKVSVSQDASVMQTVQGAELLGAAAPGVATAVGGVTVITGGSFL
jgi:hypothetical protein